MEVLSAHNAKERVSAVLPDFKARWTPNNIAHQGSSQPTQPVQILASNHPPLQNNNDMQSQQQQKQQHNQSGSQSEKKKRKTDRWTPSGSKQIKRTPKTSL